MKVELRPIVQIKPYDKNPRVNDQAVEAVSKSIKEFGFRQPIVVDADGVIICGHTRYKAATAMGLEKVPVHVAKDLSPAQIKAYRLADNKTHELAEWDLEALAEELVTLDEMDFTMGAFGFDPIDTGDAETDKSQSKPPDDLKFCVIVECISETHQSEILNRLEQEGLSCRLLIS